MSATKISTFGYNNSNLDNLSACQIYGGLDHNIIFSNLYIPGAIPAVKSGSIFKLPGGIYRFTTDTTPATTTDPFTAAPYTTGNLYLLFHSSAYTLHYTNSAPTNSISGLNYIIISSVTYYYLPIMMLYGSGQWVKHISYFDESINKYGNYLESGNIVDTTTTSSSFVADPSVALSISGYADEIWKVTLIGNYWNAGGSADGVYVSMETTSANTSITITGAVINSAVLPTGLIGSYPCYYAWAGSLSSPGTGIGKMMITGLLKFNATATTTVRQVWCRGLFSSGGSPGTAHCQNRIIFAQKV